MHAFISPYFTTLCLFILAAGYNHVATSERVYGTQITIGPDIAQDIKDLLLDDFSGDGRPDLITATGLSPALNFVENEGQGLFRASSAVDSNLSWSATAWKVASGDFDYDGNQDLVVIFTGTLRIYWNNAVKGAEFSTFDDISLDAIFDSASFVDMDVQAADMNEDGYPDIIVTAYQGFDKSTTALLVLQNDGNGGFSDINVLADDVQGFSTIAIGDFDGDGLEDIALNAMKRNMVFVYINNGKGAFERQIVDISASSNKAIAAGDVNDDGYDDLLCQGEDTTTLYVNNRDGTFQEMFQYEVDGRFGPKQRRVQFFDVDGDGLMDLVSMSKEIVWQKQTSSNPLTFSDPYYLNVETAPKEIPGSALSDEKFLATGFAFSDINGDGIEDFIACKYTSPPSVFAFLGEIDTSSSDVSSTSEPTKKPTNNPTNIPTKQPVAIDSSPLPTKTPTKQPSTTTNVTSPTNVPTSKPIQKSFAPSEALPQSTEPATTSPKVPAEEVNIKFGVVVSAETNFSFVEKVFMDSVQSVLRNSTQLESMLDFQSTASGFNITNEDIQSGLANETSNEDAPADNGRGLFLIDLPAQCSVEKEGYTDEQCRTLNNGQLSYKCGEETGYVCCMEDQGLTIAVGTSFGLETCSRNNPLFDASVHSVVVTVMSADCADINLDSNELEDNQCIIVDMTIVGPKLDDLVVLKDIVVDSTESGDLASTITSNNLDYAIFTQIKETESPSLAPSSGPTQSPSLAPSLSPTQSPSLAPSLSPTSSPDPCPLLTEGCNSCVANSQCLWCHEGNFCFNSDPKKRMPVPTNGFSRFLAPQDTGGCSGIPADGSAATCASSSATKSLISPNGSLFVSSILAVMLLQVVY